MTDTVVTVFGVCALTFMMAMYALKRRHRINVAAFAVGCLASSAHAFASGALPFGVVELVWGGDRTAALEADRTVMRRAGAQRNAAKAA